MKHFVRAPRGERQTRHSDYWRGKRIKFAKVLIMSLLVFCLFFLGVFSYLYGNLFKETSHSHKMRMLVVDYDQSTVGSSMQAAYGQLRDSSFPTLVSTSPNDYPDPASLTHEVCKNTHIWGAVFVHSGASTRLADALAGGDAASRYNASDTITYIYNGVRYPAYEDSVISANMQKLVTASAAAYLKRNGSFAFNALNISSPAARAAVTTPFLASSINLMPTEQGARIYLTGPTIALTIIQQFFFVLASNGIFGSFGLFAQLPLAANVRIRLFSGLLYTFCQGLATTGYIWAFRETWNVSGDQFVLTWISFWLFMHTIFTIVDAATAVIPMTFISFFLISWVIGNLASVNVPFELSSGFYSWGWFFPAHSFYQILVTIWSRGCAPNTYRCLPILFTWWVVGLTTSFLGMVKRCNDATIWTKEIEKDEEDVEKRASSSDLEGVRSAQEKEIRDEERRPDSLGLAVKQPFQDALGLSVERSAPGLRPMRSASTVPQKTVERGVANGHNSKL